MSNEELAKAFKTIDGYRSELQRSNKAHYYYFKQKGKFVLDSVGATIPMDGGSLTHDKLLELNNGRMPGISGDGKHLHVVVIDPTSYPRFIPPEN